MILDGLSSETTDIDTVITWCDLSVPAVMAAALELELAGMVQRHFGNRVSRCMTGL
jgi:DNA processing protein